MLALAVPAAGGAAPSRQAASNISAQRATHPIRIKKKVSQF
jgi:hypothetical protein